MDTQPEGHVALVNVLTDRDLSRQLAVEWGVEHESPQLLWKDAQGTVHHISHFGISGEWLNDLN